MYHFTGYGFDESVRGRQSFSELLAVFGTDYTSTTKSRRGTIDPHTFIIYVQLINDIIIKKIEILLITNFKLIIIMKDNNC